MPITRKPYTLVCQWLESPLDFNDNLQSQIRCKTLQKGMDPRSSDKMSLHSDPAPVSVGKSSFSLHPGHPSFVSFGSQFSDGQANTETRKQGNFGHVSDNSDSRVGLTHTLS